MIIPDKMQVLVMPDHPRTYAKDVPTPTRRFRVPAVGRYVQGLQDVYSGEWFDQNERPCPRAVTRKYKNPPYDGLPSTVQMWGATKIDEFFPLNEEWQNFWLDLIDLATNKTLSREWLPFKQLTPNHLLYWWMYATQHSLALTDNHAALYHGELLPNGCADYILRLNLGNKPIAIKSLSMTENIFRVKREQGQYYAVETINAGYLDNREKFVAVSPPKAEDVFDNPCLIHWGVESTTKAVEGGGYVQSMFPPKPYGLPFPVLGLNGENLIKKSRFRDIENGIEFSQYYP